MSEDELVLSYDGPVTIEDCPTCGGEVTNFTLRPLDDVPFSMSIASAIREVILVPCGHHVRDARVNTIDRTVAWNQL